MDQQAEPAIIRGYLSYSLKPIAHFLRVYLMLMDTVLDELPSTLKIKSDLPFGCCDLASDVPWVCKRQLDKKRYIDCVYALLMRCGLLNAEACGETRQQAKLKSQTL